jgi:hypothetical protein
MSVMTPDQLRQRQGRGGQPPLVPQPQPAPQLQRQAVIDQLGTSPDAPAPLAGAQPAATSPGIFARGGKVKQLPGMDTGKLAAGGLSTGANIAGKALGATATGAAVGSGISLGTDYLAGKLKPKEDMPTFGGPNGQYLDAYGRRFEGTGPGVAGGAVKGAGYGANPGLVAATGGLSVAAGALGGAIWGAATKNAKSAFTDFRVEDAAEAIKNAYKNELGREASDDEVMAHLVGTGFDPTGKDRWSGEKDINRILNVVRESPEAQAFRTRGSVVDQLGQSPAEPAAAAVQAAQAASRAAGPKGTGTVPRTYGAGDPAAGASVAAASGQPTATTDLESRAGQGAGDLERQLGLPAGSIQTATGSARTAAPDASGWNTDGYQAPGYVPAQAGPVPAGWDATKWNDPNHQTPKYGVGRILSNFPPTVEGLAAAMPDIEQAYPGTTFNGKDKLTIPGVGTVDVLEAAGVGGKAWRWGAEDGGGGGGAAARAGGARAADTVDLGARAPQPDVIDQDTLAALKAELERIISGQPDRQALLSQMGAA